MKTCGGGGIAPPFLTSALDGGEWSASGSVRLTPGEGPCGNYWIEGWVGPRAGLDNVKWRTIFVLHGNLTPTVQPIARRYTDHIDRAIPAHR
jgi:hypothetical protein